jgi:intracellular multiplication protein IcmG
MAEKNNFDEEYQYVEEPDTDASEKTEEEPAVINPSISSNDYADKFNSIIGQPNVRRNAIIAVLVLFTLIGVLKCTSIGSIEHEDAKNKPEPIARTSQMNPLADAGATSQQNLELLQSQKALNASISGLSEQINQMNTQIASLSQTNQATLQQINELNNKIQMNQQVIQELIASTKTRSVLGQKTTHHVVKNRQMGPQLTYYLQAVIPGRAWLVSSDGRTLTVRQGSKIPAYGIIKHIDAMQGRLTTTSGRVIVFNQAD